jgi:hypothetical protein
MDFIGKVCWQPERVDRVINKLALDIEDHDFMATHIPFEQLRYVKTSQNVDDKSERGLLAELQRRAAKDSHCFAVIEGIPGTGKSNLIRWLHYRHQQASDKDKEVTLLIRRENSSLRQALREIISKLDSKQFAAQRQALENASIELSKDGLQEAIIDNVRIGTIEQPLPLTSSDAQTIMPAIGDFLLDKTVRQALKAEKGAVQRIVRKLTTGSLEDMRFTSDDFLFSANERTEIQQSQGYQTVKAFARQLQNPSFGQNLRESMARYFNDLLPFVVSKTSSLSPDMLKDIFLDLRRELRKEGRNLSLFIEDITALTGLDRGLIDALTTRHEGDRNLCRLISVVGVTDFYFKDIPQNMRDRMDYHISLDKAEGRGSDLLNADTVADMVARYLNAMRLNLPVIQTWHQDGSSVADLPNACVSCSFRQKCHAAFGKRVLSEDGTSHEIGMYPFNANMLATMYSLLKEKTPRNLLETIVIFILNSYASEGILKGEFPESARVISNGFQPPALRNPNQRGRLREINATEQERINALLVYWGNGLVEQDGAIGEERLGAVPRAVFDAFQIKIDWHKLANTALAPVADSTAAIAQPQNQVVEVSVPSVVEPVRELEEDTPDRPYLQAVEQWRSGGTLEDDREFRNWLVGSIRDYIDWQAHDIPYSLIKSRITIQSLGILGQKTKMQGIVFAFERTDALADVLVALAQKHKGNTRLSTFGTSDVIITGWIRQQEAQILNFVRQPQAGTDAPESYNALLFKAAMALAVLHGAFEADAEPASIMQTVMLGNFLSDTPVALDSRPASWTKFLNNRRIAQNSPTLKTELHRAFNKYQGSAWDSIKFIDAQAALISVQEFQQQNWILPEMPDKVASDWEFLREIYQELRESFDNLRKDQFNVISDYQARLEQVIGESDASEVLQAVNAAIRSYKNSGISVPVAEHDVSVEKLRQTSRSLKALLNPRRSDNEQILAFSGCLESLKQSHDVLVYLEKFVNFTRNQQAEQAQEINDMESGQGAASYLEIGSRFDAIVDLLGTISGDEA